MDPFVVMIVGMAVVFLGLVILICIVKLVSFIYRALFGNKEAQPAKTGANSPVYSPELANASLCVLSDEQRRETVAAISAAIAEAMGKPVSGIRIHSIKKIG